MKPWMNCLAHRGALDHQVESPAHLPDRVHAVIDASCAEPILRRLMPRARLAELIAERHAHVVVNYLAVVAPMSPDLDAAHDA
jgi:hypothetical protein